MSKVIDIIDENIKLSKDNLILKNYDSYLESIENLSLENVIVSLDKFSNKDINEGLEYFFKNLPIFNESDKLSYFIHKAFKVDSFSNILSEEELEYLLDMLINDESIDISKYEKLLKLNYNYKFKSKIDKLLSRKHNETIKVYHKSNKKEFIYKLLLSIMNNNVKNYYSLDTKEYFSNIYKQNKVNELLSNLGYKNITSELEKIFKDNDYNYLYNFIDSIKLSNNDINSLISIVYSEPKKLKYDLSKINFIHEDKTSFKEFIKRNNMPYDLIKDSYKLVYEYFKDDIAQENLSFSNALKNQKNLEILLLKLRNIYKQYGFNIDINYIKDNLDNYDYIKELFILKTLYHLIILMNQKNINSKNLENKEEFLKFLTSVIKNSDKNLAEKLNSNEIKNEDLYAILLFLDGSKELDNVPLFKEFEKSISKLGLENNYTFIDRFNTLNEGKTYSDRIEKFGAYFTDLSKLKYLSQTEIEIEISRQLYHLELTMILSMMDANDLLANQLDFADLIHLIHEHKEHMRDNFAEYLENNAKKFKAISEESEALKEEQVSEQALELIKDYAETANQTEKQLEELHRQIIEFKSINRPEYKQALSELNRAFAELNEENEKATLARDNLIEEVSKKGITVDLDELSNKHLVQANNFDDFEVFEHDEKIKK